VKAIVLNGFMFFFIIPIGSRIIPL